MVVIRGAGANGIVLTTNWHDSDKIQAIDCWSISSFIPHGESMVYMYGGAPPVMFVGL